MRFLRVVLPSKAQPQQNVSATESVMSESFVMNRSNGLPPNVEQVPWIKRSMAQLSDNGTIPPGMPLALTDHIERMLWLTIYVAARDQWLKVESSTTSSSLADEAELRSVATNTSTVDAAVDHAIRTVTEKNSTEFRFAMRWRHSLRSCLAMKNDFRSSDIYS
jgi:hypothetical protein